MTVSNMNLIHTLVSQLCETQAWACGGSGDGLRTKTIIKLIISDIYLIYLYTIWIDNQLSIKWPGKFIWKNYIAIFVMPVASEIRVNVQFTTFDAIMPCDV